MISDLFNPDVLKKIIWTAGFLEGDGSFNSSGKSVTISAGQHARNKEVLIELQVFFDGNISYQKKKNQFCWRLHGNHAIALMFTLYSFMTPKRQKEIKRCIKKWKTQRNIRFDDSYCARGHPLSGKNLYISPKGVKECRKCINENQRKRRNKYKTTICQDLTN